MATTKFYLDTRSGEAPFPLKLTITHERKAVYMPLGIKLSPEQWDGVKVVKHPRAGVLNNQLIARKADIDTMLYEWQRAGKTAGKTAKEIREMLEAAENGVAEAPPLFKERLLAFARNKSKGTATLYYRTLDTMARFCDIDNLAFHDITPSWLASLDAWMAEFSPSPNARAIHFRNIRAIFNDALNDEIITCYPFRRFKIKTVETAKRSLTLDELRALLSWDVEPHQRQYRDIFLLIFLLRGINLIDLCFLTKDNVVNGRVEYNRRKTKKLYSVRIEPEAQEIINRYAGERYLLDIMERYKMYDDYKTRINKELKRIGLVKVGKQGKKNITPLFPKLSVYWARHTFANIARHECELSMDMIADLLGHSNGMAVTNVYVRKDEKRMDEAARKVIDKILYGC